MSLYESGDFSGKISLQDLCNENITEQLWNITVDEQLSHLMPRAYMETIIYDDLNKLDDENEYNQKRCIYY